MEGFSFEYKTSKDSMAAELVRLTSGR